MENVYSKKPTISDFQNANWIKAYIVDVLPCLTALLYLLAVIYNIAFFSVFNIDVTDFQSFIEMLVSIIQPFLLLSVFLLLLIALSIYFIPFLVYEFNKRRKHGKLSKKKIHYLRLFVKLFHSSELYKSFKLFSFSLIVITPSYFYLFTKDGIDNFGGRYSGFVPIFIPILLTMILMASKLTIRPKMTFFEQMKKITIPDKILTFILFFIFAISVVYESGLRDGKTLLDRDEVTFKITLTDNSSYDNKKYTYIKHSNGRIFIYDKNLNSSLILYEENVLSLRMNMKNVHKKSIVEYILDN